MGNPLESAWNAALPRDDTELTRGANFAQLNQFFDGFLEVVGLPVAIIDLNGHVLASSRWQRLCSDFHRANPATCARCIESDTHLAEAMRQGGDYAIYRCRNGLTDCAAPIFLDGHHVANLFIGQFLVSAPDLEFFRRQAETFGFDSEAYLRALEEIPLVPETRIPALMRLLSGLAQMVANMTLARWRTEAAQAELERRVDDRTRELFDARQMLSLILDTIPQGVYWKSRELTYLGGNRVFREDCGLSVSDLPGKRDDEMPWAAQAAGDEALDRAVMDDARPCVGEEMERRRADGSRFWARASKLPLRAIDGGVLGLLGVYEDITERKRVEAELTRSNVDLEQFAYAISHDMRQPLRMVGSYLQLLEKSLKGKLDPETLEYLNFAREGARRMDGMILALLDFSRVGRKTEPKTLLQSRAALDEALAFLGPEITAGGGQVEILGEWPALLASRDEMVRLFQNLVGNALKYHEPGTPPRVEVRGALTARQVWRCEVRDQGIGIDPGQMDRLFKVFSRLQARSRYEGTGVGLALCRKIVEHHAGRIGAESPGEGQGSVFWFELPWTATPSHGET
jgi:PAS domain S-box-containing protein